MYQYKVKVLNVVDGDTVDGIIDLGFNISFKMRFRLYGINTPEMHVATMDKAKLAKARVEGLLLNKECVADTYKPDKYGRWLAAFTVVDSAGVSVNVNQTLVKEGLAVEYML